MSSLSPLSTSTLQNTINTSQQQINDILKSLQTGLAINSVGDDPSTLAISDRLNSQALEAASTSANVQNGLTYLQVAQQSYSNIITELNKVKDIANTALTGTYNDAQLQAFQNSISESINTIKEIEENTTFNGVQVFNNTNSAGSVNEHMFAITSKTTAIVTTITHDASRGYDYSSYLSNPINRYIEQADGTLVNGVDANLTPGANVITIKSADELIAALDNQGAATAGKTYVLLNNIDLSSKGTLTDSLLKGSFQGTMLGNGYAISGLKVNSTNDNAGLFSQIMSGASVKDLILKDFNIIGNDNVGSLAGFVNTAGNSISNIAVLDTSVTAQNYAGGLAGRVWNTTLTDSYSTGTVKANIDTSGGLLGDLYQSSASNLFSTANVSGGELTGGLIGLVFRGSLNESYALGSVSGTKYVGGLIGSNSGSFDINNSYSTGNVSGQEDTAGLIGLNSGVITNSYSLSKVTDTSTSYAIDNFAVAPSGETVQGLSERPNDTYNVVYKDGSDKTWAFSSADDYNKFVNSNGTIGQFYELTDAVNNIWTGRTQQADAATYSSTATGASVANLPDSPYGTFDILYNGNAFSTKADYDAFLAGSGEISLFYNYNSMTSKWDAMKQALDAGSGDYTYAATAQGVNSVSTAAALGDDYNIIKTITGTNAGTYAFATETDASNFNDGVNFLGNIGKFYKQNDNLWEVQSVNLSTQLTMTEALAAGYNAAHIITDASQFVSKINADKAGSFIMVGDIDMTSLGTLTNSAITGNFTGKLDGNGYSVKNLTIDTGGAAVDFIGLFSRLSAGSEIKNLGVEATITATSSSFSGILAGMGEGTISNSKTSGTIAGEQYAGGFVGGNNGSITNSYALSTVSGTTEVGGFAGYIGGTGTITNSYNAGDVTGYDYTGGFVGLTAGIIANSSATGNVTGHNNVGGFAGGNTLNISDSFSTGTVTGNDRVGGFSGSQSVGGAVSNSYTTSNVSGVSVWVGGFLGIDFGGTVDNTNFYKNNKSTSEGSAVNANVSAMPTGTWNTSTWDLSGENPSLKASTLALSKPNEANYDYSYTSTGGALGAGTFYFDTVESKNNFISINDGSTASYADIYTYKSNGTTWDLQKISGTITPDSYTSVAEGSASVTSRPDKEGYDVISADGKAAFSSAADLANYNSGTYIGAISSFYEYNGATKLWDEKKITADSSNYAVTAAGGTVNPGLSASPNVSGYTYLQTITAGGNAIPGTYAFNSAADRQSFIDFNDMNTTAKPIDNYYKMSATTTADPITGKLNYQWTGQALTYNNNVGFLVGTNGGGSPTGSFYGSGVASASYVGDDGVQILGNTEIANPASTPLNTWDTAIWDLSGARPTLKNTKAEGSENIPESTLPGLGTEDVYTYSTKDTYSTTYSQLNVALNSYTNTVATPISTAFKSSITEAQALSSGYDAAHIIHTASEFVSKINGHLTENFIMVGDIDMSSLGTLSTAAITGEFTGNLDGNGYDVNNLTIDTGGASIIEIGLFGRIAGSVKNLDITNASITATNSNIVGALTGYNKGQISNVQVSGTVSGGTSFVGGLVGYSTGAGVIDYASSSVNVTGQDWKVGGLVGENNAIISNSSASGSVNGTRRTGGFVGFAGGGSITNSYATGNVTASQEVGGFIGYNYNTSIITKSYATGNITAGGGNVGGFAGLNSATIGATNFYKNNKSSSSGSAVDANVSAQPTGTWDINTWDLSGALPTLRELSATSIVFATNKLISNMTVSNAADSNQIFTEGKDFTIYTNDSGATWEMDILSSDMAGKNIKIDYEGVPTGTTSQATSGFDLYMGNNQNMNIKDMVLDFAGRLNFNITQDGAAKGLLDSVNSTLDYMNIKDVRIDGLINLATNALSNKTEKNTALNIGVKALRDVDVAKQTALLLKDQMRLQTASKALNQFYESQVSIAQKLMTFSTSAYSSKSTQDDSTTNSLYSGLTGINYNSSNSAVKNYYYKNLYEKMKETALA